MAKKTLQQRKVRMCDGKTGYASREAALLPYIPCAHTTNATATSAPPPYAPACAIAANGTSAIPAESTGNI